MQPRHSCRLVSMTDRDPVLAESITTPVIVRWPQRVYSYDTISCRQAMLFKKKQSAVDEQIAEIDKMNAVINAAERDMLKLRKVCGPSLWQQLEHHQCVCAIVSLLVVQVCHVCIAMLFGLLYMSGHGLVVFVS